ncbi:type ISP restriction/modification enzyme [Flavobacterium aquiphilum]|uniref:type ISP restriction/modification enzyme n=1 Tax=Flavobacterium aquiphilum TaxID=3003261 RepID=UPI0024815F24|nr:type ISP restriction/modification enzyme [Flavobacterium aquiphilum]
MELDQYLSTINSLYKLDMVTELFGRKIPVLTQEIINQMAKKTGLYFVLTKNPEGNVCMANNKEVRPEFRQNFSAVDSLDYMYAIFHSSNFSSAEKESFGMGFQYPGNAEVFWVLTELGSQLKQIHSLKKIKSDMFITEFSVKGNCIISNPHFEMYSSKEKNYGHVYINESQFFENVPETTWIFTIQNHQPAQKWLENKKGQKMNPDDIIYYQKILFALSETEQLVSKINEIKLQ